MAKKRKKSAKPDQASVPKSDPTKAGRHFRVRSAWILLISTALLAAGLFYFVRHKPVVPGKYKDYNLVLITMDTVRADHLRQYGYSKIQTPNLDRLAAQSYIFQDAMSHAPLTLPSHVSMLTGKIPRSHGVLDNGGFHLHDKEITLPEILKEAGYRTGAVVSSFVLDSRWGLDQGFDDYYDNFSLAEFKALNPHDAQRRAVDTQKEAELWLDSHYQNKFFFWVHFFDPHEPYDPPEPYRTEYSGQPYDGEIAYMDQSIGKLLDKLLHLGIADRTIIILTSDHGEGLGEHNELSHSTFLYNTTQHVPFFIRLPDAEKREISGIVRQIDLAPTALDLLGVEPPKEMQGLSLIPMMNGKKEKRAAYSESAFAKLHYGWAPLESITTGEYKYIHAPKPELYDRSEDYGEKNNLISARPEITKALKQELTSFRENAGASSNQEPQKIDPEIEENLRSLGYVTGVAQSSETALKIDPKDKIHIINAMQKALMLTQQQDYAGAIQIITPVLQECPELIDGHFTAAAAYEGLQQYDNAILQYQKTIALRPDYAEAKSSLASIYEAQGKLAEAERYFLEVVKQDPEDLYASLRLGVVYRRLNQPDRSAFYFSRTITGYREFIKHAREDELKATFYSRLAEIYAATGDFTQAEENYKQATLLAPNRPNLHFAVGNIRERNKDITGAIMAYRKEIEIAPQNFRAFHNLGILYGQAKQFEAAAACFQQFIRLRPREPRGYILLASVLKAMGKEVEANQVMMHAKQLQ
jgi:arylsulfatase A-like enzyme/Flp pilus assembly protein TadD